MTFRIFTVPDRSQSDRQQFESGAQSPNSVLCLELGAVHDPLTGKYIKNKKDSGENRLPHTLMEHTCVFNVTSILAPRHEKL